MKRNKKNALDKYEPFDYIINALMVIILVITLVPVLNVCALSFSDSSFILANEVSIFPKGFNLDAYKEILSSPKIPRAYLNTIIYTAVGVVFNLLFTVITAYPLSRKNLLGRKQITVFMIITLYFSGGMIPKFLLVSSLGLLDTMWSLIFPTVIWTFYLLVMRNAFEAIPEELHEASVMDGADEFTILTRVYLPNAKAAISSIALYFFMGHWNDFFIPSIYLSSAEKYPLQVVLRDMLTATLQTNSNSIVDIGTLTPVALKNATIFVSIIPMLIAYPLAQKYFAKGVMVGAVKG
ncbi:MAG: carbohydrate ABC transporter permease [Oscillospiraceae bacterium]|nr:carbohydrate ABC transporter permease [Oscillospiraceae bacterium]